MIRITKGRIIWDIGYHGYENRSPICWFDLSTWSQSQMTQIYSQRFFRKKITPDWELLCWIVERNERSPHSEECSELLMRKSEREKIQNGQKGRINGICWSHGQGNSVYLMLTREEVLMKVDLILPGARKFNRGGMPSERSMSNECSERISFTA